MKILLFLLTIITTSAFAGEILVAEYSAFDLWGSARLSNNFAINEELGRAWVEISISRNEPDFDTEVQRVRIPGLEYNSSTKTITIDHEGRIVDCANVIIQGRSIFRTSNIKSTGSCNLIEKKIKFNYDNGFEIVKREKTQVILVIK